MEFPINENMFEVKKYSKLQLHFVRCRDFIQAHKLGVSLEDYLALIR